MSRVYSTEGGELELLRAIAERQGVEPENADLEAVQPFLDGILPVLAELERRLPPETLPAR